MNLKFSHILYFSVIWGSASLLQAQQPRETPVPSSSLSKAVSLQDTSEETADTSSEEKDEENKPFVPHWSGQMGLSYSTQPDSQGQGQNTKELTFTGTYDMTESGHFLSMGIIGGQQLVEGVNTNYGELTAEGGLGLGSFQPSLSLALQQGASALNSYSSSLTLNFELLDFLTVGVTGGGGLESHQGPSASIYPKVANPDAILEVDSGDWTAGLIVSAVPWEFVTLSLTGQQETDVTYQTQTIAHTSSKRIDQSERMPSLSLEAEIAFLKDFQLDLTAQAGHEYLPAGTLYNARLGKTVTNTKATDQAFSGYTMGLMYNFQ